MSVSLAAVAAAIAANPILLLIIALPFAVGADGYLAKAAQSNRGVLIVVKEPEIKRVALIDIGSNSVHTCVYEVENGMSFKTIVDTRDFVGLGSYVGEDGFMSERGIAEGAKAVRKMVRLAKMAESSQVFAFATAAVRNCRNSKDVVAVMERESDCPVRILSGKDEAHLSVVGALQSTKFRSGLFFDLGGGSTELTGLRFGKLREWDSIPVGSLSSWKNSGAAVIPDPAEIEAIEQGFKEMLRASSVNVSKYKSVCGIGGSARLALNVACALDDNPRSDRMLSMADLEKILEIAKEAPDGLARLVLGIKPGRVHTFVPGCAISHAILSESGCNTLEISKTGLREGFLVEEVLRKRG